MIMTIFRSRLRLEHKAVYYEMAAKMRELAEKMPGFISFKTFKAEDGERVSIIEFASEETLRAWREHPKHVGPKRWVERSSTPSTGYRSVVSSGSMDLRGPMPNHPRSAVPSEAKSFIGYTHSQLVRVSHAP